jgi:FdhD/NarQ family
MFGAPIVASVSLAIELAERFGVALAGFLRDARCNIYAHMRDAQQLVAHRRRGGKELCLVLGRIEVLNDHLDQHGQVRRQPISPNVDCGSRGDEETKHFVYYLHDVPNQLVYVLAVWGGPKSGSPTFAIRADFKTLHSDACERNRCSM